MLGSFALRRLFPPSRAPTTSPVEYMVRSHRLRWPELLPWVVVIACYQGFPSYLALGSQVMIMVLFALSLDLIMGYAGIVTLGHAAFFGVGAYSAGLLAVHGWGEPISALAVAAVVAGLLGIVTGAVILRTHGLTLLMLTLAVVSMLSEAANKAGSITGGADGLQGITLSPLLGLFRFDMFGRTAYIYCAVVLLLAWAFMRVLVHSPFGRSLTGVRENLPRMHAIGAPVHRRLVTAYAISAALAGVAGALQAQTTQFVGLNVISFDLSGAVLIMLILGGVGRLYGAFIGAPIYLIAQDMLSRLDPVYWFFWVGLLLVVVVLFARGGILGLFDALRRRIVR
ncbi:MAG TPA: branched-chain amino acid ABC transporter permease [Azospirillum sp.]|nr:branched-chain amino acid ABC transporter permease [Azospirillum sp.]